ncbi:unnamed protein product [Adineta ricciae]|nr:unnamed protein product [Adineta ricciae]
MKNTSSKVHSYKSITASSSIGDIDTIVDGFTDYSSTYTDSPQQLNCSGEGGIISVYKNTRGGNFLRLDCYTYQINQSMANHIKWKCRQSRNMIECSAKIYSTKNLGTKQMPAYHNT